MNKLIIGIFVFICTMQFTNVNARTCNTEPTKINGKVYSCMVCYDEKTTINTCDGEKK